ncbi:MAG TPA: hypothetical protein VGR57_09675 [Ktedonobacterales bacterium]|nr:hypothetical protein [Ktedonobacterales bacterium]
MDMDLNAAGEVALNLFGLPVRVSGPLDAQNRFAAAIMDALRAALPPGTWIDRVTAHPAPTQKPAGQADGGTQVEPVVGLNQAAGELAPREWAGMRFRSESEVRIAQALDRAGVLFLPGALVRLGLGTRRQNREADFLVCHQGNWGILEVDGEPFHSGSRHLADTERDELFRAGGVETIRRYDAGRCASAPDEVVAEFLEALRKTKRP